MRGKIAWRVDGIFEADPEAVYHEIGEGLTTPEAVLEKARDENTELHQCFEWDDTVAAKKYRLKQAGDIIRMLVIVPERPDKPIVRAMMLTTEPRTYAPTQYVVNHEKEREAMLRRAFAEMEAFRKKYANLSELEEVNEAISDTLTAYHRRQAEDINIASATA